MGALPLISIVIATYNSSSVIRNSLKSVLNQKFQDWECLVIDGASSDETIEIVKDFALKDNRFHYISEPDEGVYDAFNKGWKNAKGEWIYYLGSDDILFPTGLYDLTNSCNLDEYDVVYGRVKMLRKNGEITNDKTSKHRKLTPNGMPACHQAIITRNALFQKLSGFDVNLKVIADRDFFIRLYLCDNIRFFYADDVFVATFTSGGLSANLKAVLKESRYVYKKNKLGARYMLYQYTIYIRRKIGIRKLLRRFLNIFDGLKQKNG
ncbi:MAG: glycosyltransferase [Prevotella sp.]|nr:glycosyltransferase [Prevotella sp.]